jgi:CDP-glucose 4,6-dehydratase
MGQRGCPVEKVVMTPTRLPDANFWRNKRVLVTGHTGFKGAWLALWLVEMGADVTGISLQPNSEPNLFESLQLAGALKSIICDIRNKNELNAAIRQANPEITLHLAAQALVLTSYEAPDATFETNVLGTLNVLSALREVSSCRAGVVVTSDKVYRNLGQGQAFIETDALGGFDPYSASKAACEIAVASFRASYFGTGAAIATARAGNVIGGGDWAANRIIPDAIRAWNKNEPLAIRNPESIRPWQHVLEPLAGYLVLAEALWRDRHFAQAYNLGPRREDCVSVRQLISLAQQNFGKGSIDFSPPRHDQHEASVLLLDAALAEKELDLNPKWHLETTVTKTMNWYRHFYDGKPARELCRNDITAYESSHVAF